SIKVYDGTTLVGTATANANGAWSTTTSTLSSGSHALTAKAADAAGNVSAASTAVNPVISGSSSADSILAGFPDAQNTGVRDGVTLKVVGDMTVTTPGAVISGLEIHGTLRIEADNVTVRDCKIVNEGGYHGILIPDGNSGVVVEYCDI